MINTENEKKNTEIKLKPLIVKSILGLLVLTLFMVLFSLFFEESLIKYSKNFVDNYGVIALFLSFFATAISPFPLPDHAASAFALIGGMDFWLNVGISTLGSFFGAIIAYGMGKTLKKTKLYKLLVSKYEDQAIRLVNKYGMKSIAIAALTPIPDSPLSWIAGTLNLPFNKFLIVYFVCRLIKISYFLWFIKLGLLSV
jgi:membrane protein YqaA with SNARE-associated domain